MPTVSLSRSTWTSRGYAFWEILCSLCGIVAVRICSWNNTLCRREITFSRMWRYWSSFSTWCLRILRVIWPTTNPAWKLWVIWASKPKYSALFTKWIWCPSREEKRNSTRKCCKLWRWLLKISSKKLSVSRRQFGMRPCTRLGPKLFPFYSPTLISWSTLCSAFAKRSKQMRSFSLKGRLSWWSSTMMPPNTKMHTALRRSRTS